MTVRRILVIHDDPRRAARLALELRDEGYTMISDADPTVGLSDGFDRMIVDGDVLYEHPPGRCPWINSPDVTFSPIALRARAGDLEVILAVRPPAEPTELSVGVVVIGDVRLDRRSREVHLRTDEIRLEPAEFDVLAMLMDHAGRLVTTSDLVQTIWPDDVPPPSRAPDVHIAALRRKLDHPVNVPSHISTIRGIGYRFETG